MVLFPIVVPVLPMFNLPNFQEFPAGNPTSKSVAREELATLVNRNGKSDAWLLEVWFCYLFYAFKVPLICE